MRLTPICDPFPQCVLPAPTDLFIENAHAGVMLSSLEAGGLLIDHCFPLQKFSDAEFLSLTSKTPDYYYFFVLKNKRPQEK